MFSNTYKRRFQSFIEVFRSGWKNRKNLPYAWKILTNGTCDGCALGTYGIKDWTIDGIHLCWIRLRLLEINTMPPFQFEQLPPISSLQRMTEPQLRNLGRIPHPLLYKPGSHYLEPISWDDALQIIAERIQISRPEDIAIYLTSRGTVNETYYVAQKAARFIGTNNIDNSARVCHAPSTTALKQSIGYAATTCSYKDLFDTDWIVFVGSNVANNQPVFMKYLHIAKKRGAKVAVVNPFLEPGMIRYWVPSSIDSAIVGTKIADEFFQIKPGGDIAFFNGVMKALIEIDGVDHAFVKNYANHWNELKTFLENLSWGKIEKFSGIAKERIYDFAKLYKGARSTIFVWSMGITMHEFGVQNVLAIVNTALARGMVGKPGTGLMPIRGHSGVQGGAEVGAVPTHFPGGVAISEESAQHFSHLWGFPVPNQRGDFIIETIDKAAEGKISLLYAIGSNLFAVLPDSHYVQIALQKIPIRVHHDLVLNPQMFIPSQQAVLILPATTRYEMAGGNTETTTERRIIFNPEIPGPRIKEARDEWRVLMAIAQKVKPELKDKIYFESTQKIREEIAVTVPFYNGIQNLRQQGDSFQWGGVRLCENYIFATENKKANFSIVPIPDTTVPEGKFRLTTRRGHQFNSMIFKEEDTLTGTSRYTFLMNPADMEKLGIKSGDSIVVKSAAGQLSGIVQYADIYPQTVMAFWPEANILIERGKCDPVCGIPAYRDTIVEIEKIERTNDNGSTNS